MCWSHSNNKDPYQFVDYCSVDTYKRAYKGVIMPITNKNAWVNTNSNPVEPLCIKIALGRSKNIRRSRLNEELISGIHCNHYGLADHDVRKCKKSRLFIHKSEEIC